jgi:hypothetical protein
VSDAVDQTAAMARTCRPWIIPPWPKVIRHRWTVFEVGEYEVPELMPWLLHSCRDSACLRRPGGTARSRRGRGNLNACKVLQA